MSSALVYLFLECHHARESLRNNLGGFSGNLSLRVISRNPNHFHCGHGRIKANRPLSSKGHVLESLAHVQRFIFDKTGTLTWVSTKLLRPPTQIMGKG